MARRTPVLILMVLHWACGPVPELSLEPDLGFSEEAARPFLGTWGLRSINGNSPDFEATITYHSNGTYNAVETGLGHPAAHFGGIYSISDNRISSQYTSGQIDTVHTGTFQINENLLIITDETGLARTYQKQA